MKKNPHAVALGRRGGRVRSAAKAAAVRENGKKGGFRHTCRPAARAEGQRDPECPRCAEMLARRAAKEGGHVSA